MHSPGRCLTQAAQSTRPLHLPPGVCLVGFRFKEEVAVEERMGEIGRIIQILHDRHCTQCISCYHLKLSLYFIATMCVFQFLVLRSVPAVCPVNPRMEQFYACSYAYALPLRRSCRGHVMNRMVAWVPGALPMPQCSIAVCWRGQTIVSLCRVVLLLSLCQGHVY